MKPKRKLTDLNPDEFIRLKAETKEHKKIIKLAGFTTKPNYDIWVGNNQGGLYFQSDEIMAGSELPAAYFLPSKKSTRKIVKELRAELNTVKDTLGKITTEQFIKHVLKREEEPNNLFGGAGKPIVAYGEESFEALKSEAISRGLIKENEMICLVNNVLKTFCSDRTIYDNGTWATPIIDQPKEIDFSIAGQFVEHKQIGRIILTEGCYGTIFFSGTVIHQGIGNVEIGAYAENWICKEYKLSDKEITLSNNK